MSERERESENLVYAELLQRGHFTICLNKGPFSCHSPIKKYGDINLFDIKIMITPAPFLFIIKMKTRGGKERKRTYDKVYSQKAKGRRKRKNLEKQMLEEELLQCYENIKKLMKAVKRLEGELKERQKISNIPNEVSKVIEEPPKEGKGNLT